MSEPTNIPQTDAPAKEVTAEVVNPPSNFPSIPPEILALMNGVQQLFQNIGDGMKATADAQAKATIAQAESQAKSLMHAEDQATERARIASAFLKPFFWGAFVLYTVAAIMAFTALLRGEKELTEKIVIGLFASLFSLLAGIGISRKQN